MRIFSDLSKAEYSTDQSAGTFLDLEILLPKFKDSQRVYHQYLL